MLYKPDIDVYPVRWTSRVYDSSPIINSLLLILNARLRFTGYDTLKISPVSTIFIINVKENNSPQLDTSPNPDSAT
jgi:hypothetical protein